MILYFETPTNKNGNKLQLTYNTETNEAKKEYFLFRFKDAIKINKTELNKLYKIIKGDVKQ